MYQPDRLDELELTARQLETQVAALRRELSELRSISTASTTEALTPDTAPAPEESRVDALNRALGQRGTVGREPLTAQQASERVRRPEPARDWETLFKTLGTSVPKPGPTRRFSFDKSSIENMIGRYGTLALAAITILMGVGAFLGWAIQNGMIGPELRVAIGALASVALAVFGLRLRRGDSPRFGNALLALALAVFHAVCWGAGPRLHLVSTTMALIGAALSSGALAALAWREDDQTLFNVGFGGALLAPFVTSSGQGDALLLLGYGIIVLGSAIASIAQKSWQSAPMVASLGIAIYTAAGVDQLKTVPRWSVAAAGVLFALGLAGWTLVWLRGRAKVGLAFVSLICALTGLLALSGRSVVKPVQVPLALVLVILTYLTGESATRGFRTALLGGLVLPLGALGIAVSAFTGRVSWGTAGVALVFACIAVVAAWFNRDGERATHAFTATFVTAVTVALAVSVGVESDREAVAFCIGISGFAIVAALLSRRLQLQSIGIAGGLWLVVATIRAFSELGQRPWYEYRPFLTTESGGAAAVATAWVLLSWHLSRSLVEGSRLARELPRSLLRLLGVTVAFLWIQQELAGAVSPDVSVFLLIGFYALSGVIAIYAGRRQALPLLRQVGLALAVFAALKTIAEASQLVIGWRVGTYFLSGLFLLGVAYWYRLQRPTEESPDDIAAAPPPSVKEVGDER